MSARLISVMGPIAVGKTTLADILHRQLDAKLVSEDFAGNPFLVECFEGFDELTLPSQLYFLLSRVKQLAEWAWPEDGLVVTDYAFCQDRIFATIKLEDDDRLFYEHICRQIEYLVHPPDVVVHLDAPVEELLRRIHQRGRGFEQAIPREFLERLRRAHIEVAAELSCKVVRLDTQTMDLRERSAWGELVEEVRKAVFA